MLSVGVTSYAYNTFKYKVIYKGWQLSYYIFIFYFYLTFSLKENWWKWLEQNIQHAASKAIAWCYFQSIT